MVVMLAAGCGYYWWQSVQLTANVLKLTRQVAWLQSEVKTLSKHGRYAHRGVSVVPPTPSTPEEWLAQAELDGQAARKAFDDRDYGIAMRDGAKAQADIKQATAGPAKDLALAQQRMAGVQASLSDIAKRIQQNVALPGPAK